MSETENQTRYSHLEELFNRAKPKSRYISESHIDEETSSISKEIINGDISINRTRGNLNNPAQKNSYEDMLRRRFMQQIAKEKQQLQHKLGYIENSLSHFEKYEYLKRRSSMHQNMSISRSNNDQWRTQFEEEMKRIEIKKKMIAEKSKEKEIQTSQLRQKIREQETIKRKAQIGQSIKKVRQRGEKRTEVIRQQNEKLKQLLSRKELYQRYEEKFLEREDDVLQQRKKKLAEIRQLKQPVNLQEILQHEQRVLETMKEKQALRNREKRMNTSRARQYKPSYQSAFYKQAASPQEEQGEQNPKQKLQKMRQFSEQVKTKFIPDIDENKRRQMEERLQNQTKRKQMLEDREKDLLQRPKLKGLEYLQTVKKMPKKKNGSPPSSAPKTDRIEYKNYLGSMSVDMGRPKPWNTILARGQHKVQTALLLQFESQKIEEKLKQKQVYSRVNKVKDDGSIDQQYYQMVKAKLDLLGKE